MGAFLSAPPVLATDRALGGWQPSGAVYVLLHRHGLPCLCRNSSICFSGWAEWQLVRFACLPLVRASLLAISAQTGDLWRHQINMSASLPQEATPVWGRWAAGLEKQVFLTPVIGKSVMLPDRKKQAPCHCGSGGHSGHLFSFPWPLPFPLGICVLLSLVRLFSVS